MTNYLINMKIILTTSLFFCLSITTILAQVVTTNIATPVAGLSTNSVTDFDVNSDGTILNNSASGGTALGTTVAANNNITAGSEASLILLQVTGTSGSDLDGTIEVFGGEAGLIIANPNGIDCDGCAFTNVNRVDLVTGSGYDADTNTFSTIAAADIDITSSGLTAPVLKVQTGADFNNAGAIVADTVTIDVTNFANDIANTGTGTVSADNLNIIFTDDLFSSATSFNKFSFNNLAITTEGDFINQSVLDLDNLTVKTGDNFENAGTINAASITATVGVSFKNDSTITADSLNVTTDRFVLSFGTVINAASLNVTANDFATRTDSTIDAATITIEVPNFASNINNAGNISSDSLNFILTDDFTHSSTSFTGFNNFSNLAITTDGTFTNNSAIDLAGVNLTITANSFNNTGGVVISDTFALSVAGDFEHSGTLTANSYNLDVGGNFSNNDSANDFTWGDSDTLTVSGNANIVAADFANSGAITVTNSIFDITATGFENSGNISANSSNITAAGFENSGNITVTNSGNFTANTFANTGAVNSATVTIKVPNFADDITNSGTVSATSLNFILTDDFTHSSTSFNGFNNFSNLAITTDGTFTNNATINPTGDLAITAGYTAINQGSIVSGSLDVITADFFRNLTGGDINVDNLNITAGGKVTNTANIDVGTLTITANNDSTRTNDTTGFYVSNRGNITATSLNIAAVDNFYNRGNITATNFNITRAKSVFFLNREINSFYAAGHTYDGGTISLTGDSAFIAADGSIENYGNIDLGDNILDISADSFTNKAGANVTANTVNLTVNSFVNGGIIDATVNQ